MKIKIINGCAGADFSFTPGREYEVSKELAADLIKAGHAAAVTSEKSAERAKEKSAKGAAVSGKKTR